MYEVTMDKLINKKQLPMYRKRRKMKDVLTKEELSAFFNACDNYMYKTIFMLIYGSELRVSEAVSIKIQDIDSRKMRIFVSEGKEKKYRYTVLPKASLDMLRKYYKMYKQKHPEGYIFLNREGRPLTVERTRIFFRRYRRKANSRNGTISIYKCFNRREWTLEHATSSSNCPCSKRGGDFDDTGSDSPASYRLYSSTTFSNGLRFPCCTLLVDLSTVWDKLY